MSLFPLHLPMAPPSASGASNEPLHPGPSFAGAARRFLAAVLLVCLSLTGSSASADEPRGSFGFAIEVDGEGFFLDPTLKSVTVTSVAPASAAARAGIVARDEIVEVDGHRVVGAKAKDLEPSLKKRVGESLHLRLRRPDGNEYEATLVALPRPT